MAKTINYRQYMHKAMLGLMVDVLSQVAREGLPGKHHFFITFDTSHPGVDMAASLRARYPKEMMIVLQEWFEDLAVMKDRFSVTLSFGNMPESIVVPFEAIKTFVDPSMEFGLRFDARDAEDEDETEEEGQDVTKAVPTPLKPSGEGEVVSLDKFRKH